MDCGNDFTLLGEHWRLVTPFIQIEFVLFNDCFP